MGCQYTHRSTSHCYIFLSDSLFAVFRYIPCNEKVSYFIIFLEHDTFRFCVFGVERLFRYYQCVKIDDILKIDKKKKEQFGDIFVNLFNVLPLVKENAIVVT